MATLLACGRDSAAISLTWRYAAPPPGGAEVFRDSARVVGLEGEVEVRGRIEFSDRCPDLRVEVERDDRSLGFHLVARPSPDTAGSCLAGDSTGVLEYAVWAARLPAGRYRVHVRHQVETPYEHDHGPGPEIHSGTSVRSIGDFEVDVRPHRGRSAPAPDAADAGGRREGTGQREELRAFLPVPQG